MLFITELKQLYSNTLWYSYGALQIYMQATYTQDDVFQRREDNGQKQRAFNQLRGGKAQFYLSQQNTHQFLWAVSWNL